MRPSARVTAIAFTAITLGILFAPRTGAANDTAPPPVATGVAPSTISCGVGACKRTAPASQACTPGTPSEAWRTAPDPKTGSWDGDCDGKVEKHFTNLTSGCVSPVPARGGGCIAKPISPECGEKAALFRCKPSADGKSCLANELYGSVHMECR